MNLKLSILWMFVGSVIIGIYLNAMNIMADDYSHLYFSSTTLIYSAIFMASLMSILEILMFYVHSGELSIECLITFVSLSVIMTYFLREQMFVNDKQWLKRMISHHSTAITTSKKIKDKTENDDVKKLAVSIIDQQNDEIEIMKKLINEQ